jgi:O-antigen/teichoic acid export membrane protein
VGADTLTARARLVFGRIATADPRRRRLLGIVQGGVTSLGSQALGVAVTFLSVPLTIGYLGQERYGVWVTIGSLLAWFQLTDFGLGNGLTNAITTAAGQDRIDLVRKHVSNGMVALTAISASVGVVLLIVWPWIDWNGIFGVAGAEARAETGAAVAVAFFLYLAQYPLALTTKIYLAFQEGRIANYWAMSGTVLRLAALVAVTRTQGGLVLLVLALSGTQLLVSAANTLWLFTRHRPETAPRLRDVDLRGMRSLAALSGQFFLIQVMALVTFQTDNLVISHYLGASQVPQYSLTYSLFNYTTLPQTLLFGYMWSAYSEAIARRDIDWVRRAFHRSLAGGLAFTGVAACALMVIAQPFIAWWGGRGVVPSTALIGWMAAWSVINALSNPTACLLAAASSVRLQLIYSAIATVANFGLSIFLVQRWGVHGAIAGTVIAYSVAICAPILIDAEVLLRRLARQAAPVAAQAPQP